MTEQLDVIEVSIKSGRVRVLATNKNEPNAEAIIDMAVIRRGVEEHFYTSAPAGRYQDGDVYPNLGEARA